MQKHVLSFILISLVLTSIDAQQLASWSSFHETGFVWNPAMTARYTQWEISGTHRQEWLGFDDAPKVTNLSFQMPFYQNRFTSSCAGAYLERDQVGPFENYKVGLSYAYKFAPKLQRHSQDELSIGFSANASKYQFNRNVLTFYDENTPDFINTLDDSYQSYIPNASVGIFYSSRNAILNSNSPRPMYFLGVSVNQLLPLKAVNIKLTGDRAESWDIRLQPHFLINAGYKYNFFRAGTLETNLLGLYALSNSFHAMTSCRYEWENSWWLSGGAVTNGELFMQTGVIFGPKSKLKKIVKDGTLRIGVKGDFHAGKLSLYNRTGYEVYMAYTFDVNY
ncbi:MAG TPA: PorP/SprF family type IX secretion system membrane protein [Saprospiraceae bacterium]|jgi:type IX secretion system PorP/SprF family membrane protein|nr:PorP/SprF family type IX secretion system membrane protein [Saprospiraceae bacterium]